MSWSCNRLGLGLCLHIMHLGFDSSEACCLISRHHPPHNGLHDGFRKLMSDVDPKFQVTCHTMCSDSPLNLQCFNVWSLLVNVFALRLGLGLTISCLVDIPAVIKWYMAKSGTSPFGLPVIVERHHNKIRQSDRHFQTHQLIYETWLVTSLFFTFTPHAICLRPWKSQ